MRASRLGAAALTAAAALYSVRAESFLPSAAGDKNVTADSAMSKAQVFEDMLSALRVMQDTYFQPWLGTWPTAIDWTAAVMGSHVAGVLSTLSRGFANDELSEAFDHSVRENIISTYFSQLLSYYFGQDALAIRTEAYDDILWVVLGWLDAVQFINHHAKLYFPVLDAQSDMTPGVHGILRNQSWHGKTWIPPFSHRARLFWDLASKGWDTRLCGGGMTWNPRLEPYKNAITNELFISASASMYLYFPGDDNTAPFVAAAAAAAAATDPTAAGDRRPVKPHDHKYLDAAVAGYTWLAGSGMTNDQGLFVDGFHISGLHDNGSDKACDVRNDMVYTYNQGVVLTGLLGLWKVTAEDRYLRDGHRLVQSAVRATGWDLARDRPVDDDMIIIDGDRRGAKLPPWRGLGRAGVVEDLCDARGDCSQNSHTFKGNYFHHLTAFCAPLDVAVLERSTAGLKIDGAEVAKATKDHRAACAAYIPWLRHNARAALRTRDDRGIFGVWWTVGLLNVTTDQVPAADGKGAPGVDYRNYGVPDDDDIWVRHGVNAGPAPSREPAQKPGGAYEDRQSQMPLRPRAQTRPGDPSDPNTRGRGRTVETQGSGMALLRALWEVENQLQK